MDSQGHDTQQDKMGFELLLARAEEMDHLKRASYRVIFTSLVIVVMMVPALYALSDRLGFGMLLLHLGWSMAPYGCLASEAAHALTRRGALQTFWLSIIVGVFGTVVLLLSWFRPDVHIVGFPASSDWSTNHLYAALYQMVFFILISHVTHLFWKDQESVLDQLNHGLTSELGVGVVGDETESWPLPAGMRERGDSPMIKWGVKWVTPLRLGKNHYFLDYHPWSGGDNPNHDENSQKILGVKKSDPRCIQEFIDILTPFVRWGPYPPKPLFRQEPSTRPIWRILTVPSHDPERETSGIRKIAFGIACAHATDATSCLKRSKKTQPLHKGGERTVESQEASLTIVNDRLISGQHVLLLDDVTTSGSTMRAARNVIERSGALSITAIALGKTANRHALESESVYDGEGGEYVERDLYDVVEWKRAMENWARGVVGRDSWTFEDRDDH